MSIPVPYEGAPPAAIPLLEVREVSVSFGGLKILDNVSLTVPAGKIVGLIGPNGAGKTTVFNVISGFVNPQQGSVLLDGQKHKMKPWKLPSLGVARTLQGVGLFDSLTVRDNVITGGEVDRRDGVMSWLGSAPRAMRAEASAQAQADHLLSRLKIADVADRYPTDLPYPIRKRVAIARALMCNPRLLMLDEPAGGLSQQDIDELAVLLRTLTPNTTILLVEHHMDFVMGICEQIYVLDAGKIIAKGTPTEVQNNELVRAAYLGSDDVA